MPISLTPNPLIPGMGKCTNIGLVASWLCPEREGETGRDANGDPYRFGTRASADGICDMQTVEQMSQALGLEMEYVFLSHTRGGPGSHNFAHWAMAKMDRLHEAALVEDWTRAIEAEVDTKLWPQFCLGEEHEVDWMCRVSSVMGSAEFTAIGETPAQALRAALDLAAGGMPLGKRRTSVHFSNARFASRRAFRLATDDLAQEVKEATAAAYVKDRDEREAQAKKPRQCATCQGEGSMPSSWSGLDSTCTACGGTGVYEEELLDDTMPYVPPRSGEVD